MSYAVINVDDPIGKTVGRRVLRDAWPMAMGLQKTSARLRRSFGFGGLWPRGVFRFKTHEDADAWTMRKIVERAVRRPN